MKLFKDLSEPEGDPLLSSWTGKSETRGALVLKEGPCGPVCTVLGRSFKGEIGKKYKNTVNKNIGNNVKNILTKLETSCPHC